MSDEFDYIIVGAGSAGCVLANRLSADGDTVCLLEAGSRDLHPYVHIPAGFMKALTSPALNWLYDTEPSEGTNGRRIPAPRGKTLGGSSAINGHVYNRGQRLDFDSWAQMGNRGWGYADVLPYFKRSERRIGPGDDLYRGRDGELPVTDIDWRNPVCDAFIEACAAMGVPRHADYNGATHASTGYMQRTIHKQRRMSTAVSFLNPVRHRQNLHISTNSHAEQILFEGNRAVGVRYRRGRKSITARARKEVIVSAGAIASPQLLQVSGIGAGGHLQEIGVPVIRDLPAVGENLADHFGVRIASRVKNDKTFNALSRGLPLAGEIAKYVLGRQSILALSPTLSYAFWKTNAALDSPDLQIIFTPASYKVGVPSELEDYPGMTIACWPQRPESRGFVRARTGDTGDKPEIQPNYLSAEYDQRVMLAGLKMCRQILRAPEMAHFFDHEVEPGEAVQSDDEILDFARSLGTTIYHLMGTCRMGPASDTNSVVNDELKVHGTEGLRVVDASVIPAAHSTNTNAATIMIAEKASDMILGKAPLPAVSVPPTPESDSTVSAA